MVGLSYLFMARMQREKEQSLSCLPSVNKISAPSPAIQGVKMKKAGWISRVMYLENTTLQKIVGVQNAMSEDENKDVKASQLYPRQTLSDDTQLYDCVIWYNEKIEPEVKADIDVTAIAQKMQQFKDSDRFKQIMADQKARAEAEHILKGG